MKGVTLLGLASLAEVALAGPVSSQGHSDKCDWFWDFFRPSVNSRDLRSKISSKNLVAHARTWEQYADTAPDKNRAFGGVGHNKTIDYLVKNMKAMSDFYDVRVQPFVKPYSAGSAKFEANGADQAADLFTYAPAGDVTQDLVAVSNLGCELTDFSEGVKGKIALISRGTCEFGRKVALAGASGAAGAVIYNNAPGALAGTLGAPSRPEIGPYVPVAGVSQERGQALLKAMETAAVQGKLHVEAINENRTTFNVIAQTKCGDQNNVLVVGAHTDSVPAGPGINDNGSGSIALLEVAKHLSKFSVSNAVRFTWFAAEEFGLLGSHFYVDSLSAEERGKIRLYLNFDMIASPNYIMGIYDGDGSHFNRTGPAGSAEAEHMFEDFFKKETKFASVPTNFSGRSDYGPFLEANIPAGGLFTGAEVLKTDEEFKLFGGEAGKSYDENYHKKGDTVANLNLGAWEANSKAIAHAVATYGKSWKSLPAKPPANPPHKRDVIRKRVKGRCGHKLDEL